MHTIDAVTAILAICFVALMGHARLAKRRLVWQMPRGAAKGGGCDPTAATLETRCASSATRAATARRRPGADRGAAHEWR
jgi:hypothetical protein